jgi:hypothetical protein
VRSLSPELPVAATRPLAALRPAGRAAVAAWDDLAHLVAACEDRAVVSAIVTTVARDLGVARPVTTDARLVVLQRAFGRLHRRALVDGAAAPSVRAA